MPIPIHFISGYLGSGKTTMLNCLLSQIVKTGKKIALILNDFGDICVDSSLYVHDGSIHEREQHGGQIESDDLDGLGRGAGSFTFTFDFEINGLGMGGKGGRHIVTQDRFDQIVKQVVDPLALFIGSPAYLFLQARGFGELLLYLRLTCDGVN